MRPTAFLVIPFTAEANQWLDANIDNRLMHEGIPFDHRLILGGGIPNDHTDIEAILAGLEEAGLAEGVDYEVV
jgi:hypothetical protein